MKGKLFIRLFFVLTPFLFSSCAAALFLTEAELAFLGSSGVRAVTASVARGATTRAVAGTAIRSSATRTAMGTMARSSALIIADETLLASQASRAFIVRRGSKTFLSTTTNGATQDVAEVLSKRRFKTIGSQQIIDLPGDIHCVARTEELNVRTGPGVNYEKVAIIKKGRPVAVEYKENGWCKAWVNDEIQGWISEKFLDELEIAITSDESSRTSVVPSTETALNSAKDFETISDNSLGQQYQSNQLNQNSPYGQGNGQVTLFCSTKFSDLSQNWTIYIDNIKIGNINGIFHDIVINCQDEGSGIVKHVLKAGIHTVKIDDGYGNHRIGSIDVDVSTCKTIDCMQLKAEIKTTDRLLNNSTATTYPSSKWTYNYRDNEQNRATTNQSSYNSVPRTVYNDSRTLGNGSSQRTTKSPISISLSARVQVQSSVRRVPYTPSRAIPVQTTTRRPIRYGRGN